MYSVVDYIIASLFSAPSLTLGVCLSARLTAASCSPCVSEGRGGGGEPGEKILSGSLLC